MNRVEMVSHVVLVLECAKIKTLVFHYVNAQLTAGCNRAHRMANAVTENVTVVAIAVALHLVVTAPKENQKNVVEERAPPSVI
ncbi:hypothetical protein HA402_005185 [Bradysia odoriphaga]|nr:hypothetical protein HA402_005185 [Bradysia odoriphaga]